MSKIAPSTVVVKDVMITFGCGGLRAIVRGLLPVMCRSKVRASKSMLSQLLGYRATGLRRSDRESFHVKYWYSEDSSLTGSRLQCTKLGKS